MYIDPIGIIWIGDWGFPLWWGMMAFVILVICPLLYRSMMKYARPPEPSFPMDLPHEVKAGDMIEVQGMVRPVAKVVQQYRTGPGRWHAKVIFGSPLAFPNLRRKLAHWILYWKQR